MVFLLLDWLKALVVAGVLVVGTVFLLVFSWLCSRVLLDVVFLVGCYVAGCADALPTCLLRCCYRCCWLIMLLFAIKFNSVLACSSLCS